MSPADVTEERAQQDWAKINRLVDKLIGDKLAKSIDAGGHMDVSELSYPDKDIYDTYSSLSVEALTSEINRL